MTEIILAGALTGLGLAMIVAVIALDGRYVTAESILHFAAQSPGLDPATLALSKAADAYVSITMILAGGLIFALRAALVPSPPVRTLVLTSLLGLPLVVVPFYFAPASGGLPALRTAAFPVVGLVTYAIWWAIVTAGTTVISWVVFGLRTEVRRALRLGQYTIEAKIGEGGMGVVYRAHHGMMQTAHRDQAAPPGEGDRRQPEAVRAGGPAHRPPHPPPHDHDLRLRPHAGGGLAPNRAAQSRSSASV